MACRIVHRLKTVKIDKDQRVTLMGLLYRLQQTLQMVFKADAVRQVGQGVMGGAVAQLAQHFARLGHVLNNQHRANILSVKGAQRSNAVVNVVTAAVPAVKHHILFDISPGHIAAVDVFH